MTTHELKCWPAYFQDVKAGRKPFEIRKADRPYAVGDVLWLREWRPGDYHMALARGEDEAAAAAQAYTGDECRVRVTYILGDNGPWLPTGYVAMGVEPIELDPLAVADLPLAPPPDTASRVQLIGEHGAMRPVVERLRPVVEAALAYEATFAETARQRVIASRAGLNPIEHDLPEFQAACEADRAARRRFFDAARVLRAALDDTKGGG